MSPRGRPAPDTGAASRSAPVTVAAEGRRRGRKRGGRRGHASVTAEIQTKAHERQAAWLETGQPNTTFRLTRELDELFDEHRDGQAGSLADPYYGGTTRLGGRA